MNWNWTGLHLYIQTCMKIVYTLFSNYESWLFSKTDDLHSKVVFLRYIYIFEWMNIFSPYSLFQLSWCWPNLILINIDSPLTMVKNRDWTGSRNVFSAKGESYLPFGRKRGYMSSLENFTSSQIGYFMTYIGIPFYL